jgi:hypothetical protein
MIGSSLDTDRHIGCVARRRSLRIRVRAFKEVNEEVSTLLTIRQQYSFNSEDCEKTIFEGVGKQWKANSDRAQG